jgi:penicillin-insensitive murein endopeptidase
MRRSRRRYFGHPDLVAFLQRLAAASHRKGLGPLFVGDLGQARGGPTLTGHASHQSGLDVDVLFLSPRADGKALTAADREALPARAVVDLRTFAFTPHYTPRVLTLVGLAAADPVVDRIFVHPALKRRLCDEQRGAPWQGRVRPWWGHHDHLHVRLRCPAGDTGCEGQPPLTGDGCDKGLAWWFSAESKAGPKKDPTAPPPQLPAACEALVTGGAAAP